jgi:NAD-dependent dihydropyrimidine dehydrogenase PreA subunit
MIILEEKCVGCGRCRAYCPAVAIRYDGLKSVIDQDICYECGTCLRCAHCPADALANSPGVYEYPRALRKYFSDPVATHVATGIPGRGTEESKSNDVTLRCGPGRVGVAIEIGRPTIGMSLRDAEKITRAIARAGVHRIEPHNPIHSMIADQTTGDLKPELLGERVLSAIIEIQVARDELRGILQTLKVVAGEVDGVFCIDVFTIVEPRLKIPEEVLESLRAEGLIWRPNAKINMGLGRACSTRTVS